jgi:hypothetical protein
VHKFGDLDFYDPRLGDVVLLGQSLSINSFLFLVFGFSDAIGEADRQDITRGLTETNRVIELGPGTDQVRITRAVTDSRSYLFSPKRFSFVNNAEAHGGED